MNLIRALACTIAATALILPVSRASADVLTIVAVGRIDPVCEISVSTPVPTANFATSGEVRAGALVNCNTGFIIKATSANGALKNSAAATAGFTNSLNYRLGLSVLLSGGPKNWASATCASAWLMAGESTCALSPAGPGLSSSGQPSIGRSASLVFSWKTPTKPRLVAGNYEDVMTISVAATP